jgi:hypothetical protein
MRLDRRRLLQTAGAMVTAASLYTPVAPMRNQRAITRVLLDPTLAELDLHAAGVAPGGNTWTIQQDFVRQWRDGLGKEIAFAGGATAYVRWDKALLLTGFAREARLRATQRRLSRAVFEVSIS